MNRAKLVKVADQILIHTDYNASLVEEIRGIPGRRWSSSMKVWSVPVGSEQQVREIVRRFFVIEGETSFDPYETITVKVIGRYPASVTVDGIDIFSPRSGLLDTRPNGAFEIISYTGGVKWSERHSRYTAFGIDYTLTLKVRKNAEWDTTGNGDYEIVEEEVIQPGTFHLNDVLRSALGDA